MSIDFEIKMTCDDCNKSKAGFSFVICCDTCFENKIDSYIKSAIENSLTDHTYLWTNKEDYIGFDSDKEKEIFLSGVKKGFDWGVFWIADEFGSNAIEFYEQMQEKLEKNNTELTT